MNSMPPSPGSEPLPPAAPTSQVAGLAKLSGVSFATAAAWLYGGWVVLRAGMVLSGGAATGM
jgi:hypothetical protein